MVAIVAVGLALVPVLIGAHRTPPGQTYLYTNVPDVFDGQIYYAFINENARGHPLYTNIFTSEPQRAVLFDPLWALLGAAVRFGHLSAQTAFFGANVIGGLALILVIWYLLCHFFSGRWRWICLGLVLLGGGFGGLDLLTVRAGSKLIGLLADPATIRFLPADITQPAGFTWSVLAHAPHYSISLVLLLIAWLSVWKGWRPWWGMIATTALGFIHPYDLVLLFGVLGGGLTLALLRDRLEVSTARTQLRAMGWYLVGAVPVVLYYLWALISEPTLRQWYQQNTLNAPNLVALLLGFGPLIALAAPVVRTTRRQLETPMIIVLGWAFASLILLYLPAIRFQSKMLAGWNIPLSILAVSTFQRLFHRVVGIGARMMLMTALIALLCGTAVIFNMRLVISQRSEANYHYTSNDEVAVLRWIGQHSQPGAVVLADVLTGNLVPQFAARPTFIGHNIQTIDFQRKLQLTRQWFFATAEDSARKEEFLVTRHIDYVVWGPNERRWGAFDPRQIATLVPVFHSGDIAVFQRLP